MEEDRLWKFTKPEWLNSIWARNAGIYTAGGLVRLPFALHHPLSASVRRRSASDLPGT